MRTEKQIMGGALVAFSFFMPREKDRTDGAGTEQGAADEMIVRGK